MSAIWIVLVVWIVVSGVWWIVLGVHASDISNDVRLLRKTVWGQHIYDAIAKNRGYTSNGIASVNRDLSQLANKLGYEWHSERTKSGFYKKGKKE